LLGTGRNEGAAVLPNDGAPVDVLPNWGVGAPKEAPAVGRSVKVLPTAGFAKDGTGCEAEAPKVGAGCDAEAPKVGAGCDAGTPKDGAGAETGPGWGVFAAVDPN